MNYDKLFDPEQGEDNELYDFDPYEDNTEDYDNDDNWERGDRPDDLDDDFDI